MDDITCCLGEYRVILTGSVHLTENEFDYGQLVRSMNNQIANNTFVMHGRCKYVPTTYIS